MTEWSGNEIAVVGMGARLPGARNVDEFWRNLAAGVESVTTFSDEELLAAGVDPAELANPNYVKRRPVLDDFEYFDAPFFGFSPREAAIMDPQHRQFLHVCWEALEHAGHVPESFGGSIGVFGGCGMNAYMMFNLLTNPDLVEQVGMFLLRHTGNDKDFLSTRVSYCFNLDGPSINVQTACSTSLVAIHLASQSLLSGECDLALAGGVTIELPHRVGYRYQEGEILSKDGSCRSFDHRSLGTTFGSGAGAVVLRRLEDAIADRDTIHAVIIGTAINNDGSNKVGYLAPSVDGQARSIAEAISVAGVSADSISYVEAHGTGTPVGDPIEVTALTQAFRETTEASGYCALGSVKSNIGHLDTAAGVAAFIKVALSLSHGELPASLGFEKPNPAIDFDNSPFFVQSQHSKWTWHGPRRAGVSSLGVGGTNGHIILQEAPRPETSSEEPTAPRQLLVSSARTDTALEGMRHRLSKHLRDDGTQRLADVAYTLQHGRRAFEKRRVIVCHGRDDAIATLEDKDSPVHVVGTQRLDDPEIIFMFPGGGAQYPNMGRELYEREAVYREEIDRCFAAMRKLGRDLEPLLFPPQGADLDAIASELENPRVALPTLFMTEYALAKLWQSKGVTPGGMIGHSLGEYTAACLAEVFDVETALSIVTKRGELFESLPVGGMLSVPLGERELKELIAELETSPSDTALSIAAINGPGLAVLSGTDEALERAEALLTARDIDSTRLHISVAAHSAMLDPVLDEFRAHLSGLSFAEPSARFLSNLTGDWVKAGQVDRPEYWVEHMRQSVRFADGLGKLLDVTNRLFLEVGPGQTLCSLARLHDQRKREQEVVGSLRHPREQISDLDLFYANLGRLWIAGKELDWSLVSGYDGGSRVPLPTYCFDASKFWIEPGEHRQPANSSAPPLHKIADIGEWFWQPTWTPTPMPKVAPGEPLDWLIFRDEVGLGERVAEQLERAGHRVQFVVKYEDYSYDPREVKMFQGDPRHYEQLFQELAREQRLPQRILHLWSLDAETSKTASIDTFEARQDLTFFSLLHLAQALSTLDLAREVHVGIVTSASQSVRGEPLRRPESATAIGPAIVIPKEIPDTSASVFDIAIEHDGWFGTRVDPKALDETAAAIIREYSGIADVGRVMALRDGVRFRQDLEPLVIAQSDDPLPVRATGTYLITGGLGGIGLAVARHLAERYSGIRLALVGRSALPARTAWQEWLDSHELDDSVSRKIRHVMDLEDKGSHIELPIADTSRPDLMAELVASLRERFGRIDGVFHASGVLFDGLIPLKSRHIAERVIGAKVKSSVVLSELLAKDPPDFFVMFSSTSAFLGLAGQVDYAGANAFLDAFAVYLRQRGVRAHSINWGMWQQVGMTAVAADEFGIRAQSASRDIAAPKHCLLEESIVAHRDEHVFESRLSTNELWLLSEHRLRDDAALMPGTGYIEWARATYVASFGPSPIVIESLMFLSPLDEHPKGRRVRVALSRDRDQLLFECASAQERDGDDSDVEWIEHCRASVHRLDDAPPTTLDLAAIIAELEPVSDWRHDGIPGQDCTHQRRYLDFGPRWDNFVELHRGPEAAVARLELEEAYAADLGEMPLHPALLDIATGYGLTLVEGYDASGELFVPLSYKRIRCFHPLTRTIYSHVRNHGSNHIRKEVASFDITITDASGRVLVDIEQFCAKKLAPEALFGAKRTTVRASQRIATAGAVTHVAPEHELIRLSVEVGIAPDEGVEVLDRILARPDLVRVVASSIDLSALSKRVEQLSAPDEGAAGGSFERPELDTDYVAPRTERESQLADIWQDLLGVERVGIDDDFFALGGHSLIAVRLFARINKTFGIDLSLGTLFDAPTVARVAALLDEELGPIGEAAPTSKATRPRRAWSSLVPIQPSGPRTPFFCVHGQGGHVLMLADLALRLGEDQPFYGLAARGVDGQETPHDSLEAMAADYLAEIRRVQPEGPYCVGGYSGGGIVAYEMARQLIADGERVACLAFLDTYSPTLPELSSWERFTRRVQRVMERGPMPALRRLKSRGREFVASVRARLYGSIGRRIPSQLRETHVVAAFVRAVEQYSIEPLSVPAVLFRASELTFTERYHIEPESLGWRDLLGDSLTVHEIPGSHNSMCLEPNVRFLSEHLDRYLEAASRTANPPVGTAAPIGQ